MSNEILIVEDDRDIRELMKEALELRGYLVHVCSNGSEAIDLLRKIDRPRLVILDLNMPVMDGEQFIQKCRKDAQFSSLEIVVISAENQISIKSARLGIKEIICKPINLDDLYQVVEKYCNTSSGSNSCQILK